jgi:hypothetical protein
MKLHELGIAVRKQMSSPQSAGSRGLRHNKFSPSKRYFDSVANKIKTKKTIRQK